MDRFHRRKAAQTDAETELERQLAATWLPGQEATLPPVAREGLLLHLAGLKLRRGRDQGDPQQVRDGLACLDEARWEAGEREEDLKAEEQALYEQYFGLTAASRLDHLEQLFRVTGEETRSEIALRLQVRYYASGMLEAHPERRRLYLTRLYASLREREARLRLKTRWLLWEEVTERSGDRVERARQREQIQARLEAGFRLEELPGFLVQRWREIMLEVAWQMLRYELRFGTVSPLYRSELDQLLRPETLRALQREVAITEVRPWSAEVPSRAEAEAELEGWRRTEWRPWNEIAHLREYARQALAAGEKLLAVRLAEEAERIWARVAR